MIFKHSSHRRKNILTGEWVLVSPHRTKRPWQGMQEQGKELKTLEYDSNCYLCPGNTRANNEINPDYKNTYSFINDFSAILDVKIENFKDNLLEAHTESGICKVLCYSPNNSLTMSQMDESEIVSIIKLWQKEYKDLGSIENINNIQIFENKGESMGCSNPHPHGQIWAQKSIPTEILKKQNNFKKFYENNNQSMLLAYIKKELELKERIIYENESFVALVPFWAVWPYESMVITKNHRKSILELNKKEVTDYANILKILTTKYDNLFQTSFPYSTGIHQAPTNNEQNKEWHMHMSFYPPLLRSASIKKFMVGYEMFGEPQRDITPEQAAESLRNCSNTHFSKVK